MTELNTYIVETTNAFVTLAVSDSENGGPYHATYVGAPRIDSSRKFHPDKPLLEKFDGKKEDPHFDVLLAACHKEIVERSGEIISIQKIPLDAKTIRPSH
ncbi:hypothetical protein [Collimonas pratensis]|uniref:hypothetical protein n=1 Tax=Collimonas pratensis TaxID=279113 RepID=UPI0007857260|nr:hypothetical protein [Collimonas pratensis]NKI70076.1 hypothetical protein [Collimonas pratensis]